MTNLATRRIGALAAAFALALSAIGATGLAVPAAADGDTAAPSSGVGHTVVNATLSDSMRLTLDRSSAPSGVIDFYVTNLGQLVHEFVVLKTDLPPGSLPPDPTQPGKIIEKIHMGETGDIAPGRFSGLELALGPGNYVIVCDEPGHYAAGMYAAFTVTPTIVTAALFDSMTIWVDQPVVYAGPVTFRVTNTGSMVHEIVVLKSDLPWYSLPWDLTQPGKLDESASVGETGDMNPHSYGGIGLDLAPGNYWLVCNEPGHFAAGMHVPFTVLPDPQGDSD